MTLGEFITMLTCLGTGAVLTETERETDYIKQNNQLLLLNASRILQLLSSTAAGQKEVSRQVVVKSTGDHANIKVYTENMSVNRK